MTHNPQELIEAAEEQKNLTQGNLRDAADWFHEREGEMYERSEAMGELMEAFDVSEQVANSLLGGLVGDLVDPVVQVPTPEGKYVGVVEYVEGDGWYGYTDYDDVLGESNTAVCAQCVHEATFDNEVTHAKEGKGSFSDGYYSLDELGEAILEHYENAHDKKPEDVETGADLLDPTTIGGSTAWHAGNDGSGSTLDADTVDGNHGSGLAKLKDGVQAPVYASLSDVPSGISKGEMIFNDADNSLYVEDGT